MNGTTTDTFILWYSGQWQLLQSFTTGMQYILLESPCISLLILQDYASKQPKLPHSYSAKRIAEGMTHKLFNVLPLSNNLHTGAENAHPLR